MDKRSQQRHLILDIYNDNENEIDIDSESDNDKNDDTEDDDNDENDDTDHDINEKNDDTDNDNDNDDDIDTDTPTPTSTTTKTSKSCKNKNAGNKKSIQFSLRAWSDVRHGRQVAGQAGKPDGKCYWDIHAALGSWEIKNCKGCTTERSSTVRHGAARVARVSCGTLSRIREWMGTCFAGGTVTRQRTLASDWNVSRGCPLELWRRVFRKSATVPWIFSGLMDNISGFGEEDDNNTGEVEE